MSPLIFAGGLAAPAIGLSQQALVDFCPVHKPRNLYENKLDCGVEPTSIAMENLDIFAKGRVVQSPTRHSRRYKSADMYI